MPPTTMKITLACLLVLALAAASPASAEPRPGEKSPPLQPEEPPTTTRAPADAAPVEEGFQIQHHDRPARTFEEAYAGLARHDTPAAEAALRRAAEEVKAESSRAAHDVRAPLLGVATALADAADRAADGRLAEAQTLAPLFANAHHALARDHLLLARRALDENDAENTGTQLKAALDNRYDELRWLGRELDPEARDELARIEELAVGLRDGAVELDAQAELAVRDLEGALRR